MPDHRNWCTDVRLVTEDESALLNDGIASASAYDREHLSGVEFSWWQKWKRAML